MIIPFERFASTLIKLGAKGDLGSTYDMLRYAYTLPDRAYHNWQHIEECIELLDKATPEGNALVEVALYYHDALYNSHVRSNEISSASLALIHLSALKVPLDTIGKIKDLIMATCHKEPAKDANEALIIDIDLSILGSTPNRYAEYEEAIRKEYNWVDAKTYATVRSQILSGFMGRAQKHGLYKNKLLNKERTTAAVRNLKKAIRALEGK